MSAVELDHARGLQTVAGAVDETLDPAKDDADAPTFVERTPGVVDDKRSTP
jgi:hypothetical protein